MKYLKICIYILCVAFLACSKMNDLHEPYLDGERIYAAKVDSVSARAGNKRIQLDVLIQSQRIETLRIYWNSGTDSMDVHIGQQKGIFSAVVENLGEQSHLINVVSIDRYNNRSLPYEISGNAYGDNFQASVSNRGIRNKTMNNGELTIQWSVSPERATVSELQYLNQAGIPVTKLVYPSESITHITDVASDVRYRTLFLPEPDALDTFYTEFQPLVF